MSYQSSFHIRYTMIALNFLLSFSNRKFHSVACQTEVLLFVLFFPVAGDGSKIHIYGIFITKEAGESLLGVQGPCYLLPGYEKKTWAIKWLILSVSLIVIVIVAALVTALCCIRQHILAEAEADTLNNVLNQKLLDEEIMSKYALTSFSFPL